MNLRLPIFVVLLLCCCSAVRGKAQVRHQSQKNCAFCVSKCGLKQAAVATENSQCSEVGIDVVRAGGSSVDAAIAAMVCIGAANMFASGLGGGGFALIHDENTKDASFVDFREVAPSQATDDMMKHKKDSVEGGLSIAVPGELRGFYEMHKKHGKLPWKELFTPTINLCYSGFKMTILQRKRLIYIKKHPYLEKIFKNPKTGKYLRLDEKFTRPDLAATLQLIADSGPDIFYEGEIADSIIKTIQQANGIMTKNDLQAYTVKVREPISTQISIKKRSGIEKLTVISGPPPSAGPLILKALNILEDVYSKDDSQPMKDHKFVETLKFTYAERQHLSDGISANSDQIRRIISKQEAAAIKSKISLTKTFPPDYYTDNVNEKLDQEGTSHVNVRGLDGMTVALTSSINTPFGSRVIDEKYGIILNNHMDDFSAFGHNYYKIPPYAKNRIEAGKRPQSSIAPVLVVNDSGAFVGVIGASGGSRIVSSVLQSLTKIIWEGESLRDAISSARLHHQLLPNKVVAEYAVEGERVAALRSFGHEVKRLRNSCFLSYVNAIWLYPAANESTTCRLDAFSDTRKYSKAAIFEREDEPELKSKTF